MDIFAHALWTAAAALGTRRKFAWPIRPGRAALWGVFPDLITFAVPAAIRIWAWASGASATLLPDGRGPDLRWVWGLYNCAHSVLVFAVVFGAVWMLRGRPLPELGGWAFHILIDVFTHRGMFATHFLWPLLAFRFDGIPWETGWLLVANYGALIAVYLALWRRGRYRESWTA